MHRVEWKKHLIEKGKVVDSNMVSNGVDGEKLEVGGAGLSASGVGMEKGSIGGFDPILFLENNRIHVEHGSLFSSADPLVIIHPRELRPENEQALRDKLRMAYTMDHPSFFADRSRTPIALELGNLIPISLDAKRKTLAEDLSEIIKEAQTGKDPEFEKLEERREKPFNAIIEQSLELPKLKPTEIEQGKNAIAMYLLVEDALERKGFVQPVASFVQYARTGDGAIAEIANHLGIGTKEFMETANKEGIDGIAKLIGTDPHYLNEVKRLVEYLPDCHFSANAIQNWMVGRRDPAMQYAGTREKIEAGLEPRIDDKISALRAQYAGVEDVPESIKESENMVLAAIRMLPPEISETLYRLNTEFAYTPKTSLQPIAPNVNAYGFNRHVLKNPDDIEGVYHIFVSGKQDAEEFARVVVHEAHHLLFPSNFTEDEIKAVDENAKNDATRLKFMHEIMSRWATGDEKVRQEMIEILDSPEMSVNGKSFSQMLGGASVETFYNQLEHAYNRLQIDSDFYYKGGYTTPEARFHEINSRYAELRHVRLRDNPDMLQFIVPALTDSYDNIYMPHVGRMLESLRARDSLAGSKDIDTSLLSVADKDGSLGSDEGRTSEVVRYPTGKAEPPSGTSPAVPSEPEPPAVPPLPPVSAEESKSRSSMSSPASAIAGQIYGVKGGGSGRGRRSDVVDVKEDAPSLEVSNISLATRLAEFDTSITNSKL